MIDRHAIRFFLAVIDQGNFSKAAGQCCVSQPTLSIGIAKLERSLGRSLFHRTSRRVALTPAGARFAVHARLVEAQFAEAERSVLEAGSPTTLRLGILETIPTSWHESLAHAFRPFAATDRVEFVDARERSLLDQLDRGRIDVALTVIREEGARFAGEPLFTEGFGVAMSLDHPLARERTLTAEALADNVMIVRRHCEAMPEINRHFVSRGVRPLFAAKTTNDDRALAFLRAGLGVTVMPISFADAGIIMARLTGFTHVRTIGVLRSIRADTTWLQGLPIYQKLTDTIRTLAAPLATDAFMG